MDNLFEELTATQNPIVLAQELSANVQETYFDLGCLLYNIREGDLYKTFKGNRYYSNGHKKWKQFLEENFSVSYRTAQYWMNIYRYFSEMGIDRDRITKIGWSVIKELVDVTKDVNVLNRGLAIAENGTLDDVKAWASSVETEVELIPGDGETLTSKTFKFKFYEAAGETVEQIMAEVMKEEGIENMNEAFFKIMIEWYQARIPATDVELMDYATEEEEEDALFAVG